MSNPLGLSAEELAGLVALINADDDHDDQHGHDHSQRFPLTIVSIERRAAALTRVVGRFPEGTDMLPWPLPNTALRMELPIQPPELVDIQGAPETASRVYTVAVANPDFREIAIDFALHGDSSVTMQWLKEVRPGDVIELWPRISIGCFLPDLGKPWLLIPPVCPRPLV